MTYQTRREKEKEQMRAIILEAATHIINSEGYDKLSMRKIATAIEYTPTTIYSYYKDKAQIVEGILQEVYDSIILNITKTLELHQTASIDKQLEIAFSAFINAMVDNAEMGKAVIRSGSKSMFGGGDNSNIDSPKAQKVDGNVMLQSILLQGQQESVLRELEEDISWMLITALLGFSMNAIENQLYLNKDWHTMVQTYVELLMNGLLP
jgi:AcrR family transcriptional regulator